MATIHINIPPNFAQTLNQFMVDVQKMQQFVAKFQYTQRQLPSAQSLVRAHLSTSNQVSKLNQVIYKLSGTLQRTIDTVVSSLGSIAQTFMRTMSVMADFLAPIIGAVFTMATFAVSGAVWAVTLGYKIGRWLWDGMVKLGDAMLQDYLQATGSYSTIGGLRAYRAAFGFLPDMPLQQFVQARGSVTSPQFAALRLLGVKAQADTADMILEATMAAATFMKHQGRGKQLLMAQAMAVASVFPPQTLLILNEMSEKELEKYKEMYKYYKPMLHVPLEAAKGWLNFRLQVKAAVVTIESVIAKKLADPTAPFTQAVTALSKALVKFVKNFLDIVLKKENVDKLGEYIDRFAKWLQTDDAKTKIKQVAKDSIQIIKDVVIAIHLIKKLMEYGAQFLRWLGKDIPNVEFLHGRRGLGLRTGIERPGGAEPITGPPSLGRYPGRARFFQKTGIARKPWEEKIAPRRGAIPDVVQPQPLRVPGRPEEAPETVEEAIKGGFARPGGGYRGAGAAKGYPNIGEVKAAAKEQLLREGLTEAQAEQGASALTGQAMAESGLKSVFHDQGIRAGRAGGYVPSIYGANRERGQAMVGWIRAQGGDPESPAWQAKYMAHEVMTGKGYGPSREAIRSGDQDRMADALTRNFEAPADQGPGQLATRRRYTQTAAGVGTERVGPKIGGWKVEDIPGAKRSPPPTAQSPSGTSFTGDNRLTTVGNYKLGGDQRRQKLLDAAGEASKNLPPGWRVEAYSGERTGADQGPHRTGAAIDFRLIDPQGHEVENYQHPENYRVYEKFAQDTHRVLQKTDPELASQHRWGGYFSGPLGKNPATGKDYQYGAMDLMHQDFAGGDSRMAAGSWEKGITPEWKRRWGVADADTSTSVSAPPPNSGAITGDAIAGAGAGRGGRAVLGPGASDNALGAERKAQYGEELKDPETRRLLAASVEAEVGGQGKEAAQAYVETVFNRAASRNMSLKDTMRDVGYYPISTRNKLNRPVGASEQAYIDDITGDVVKGSNVSNYATGNESQDVQSGGAPVTRDFGHNRERFIRENKDKAWVNRHVRAANTQGVVKVVPPSDSPPLHLEWEEGGKKKTFSSDHQDDHQDNSNPIDNYKVDNRSDKDIAAANTSSDNDDGKKESANHPIRDRRFDVSDGYKKLFSKTTNVASHARGVQADGVAGAPKPATQILSPPDSVFPGLPASKKSGVITGAPPSGIQRTPSSFYGNLSEEQGSVIPGGWVDKGDVDKQGKPLPGYTGQRLAIPGVAIPFKESAGRAEKQEGDYIRVKNPRTGEWDVVRQVDIGPNVFDPVARKKGIDINAALAEKWGYAPNKAAAEATGRPVYPTGQVVEWEHIPKGEEDKYMSKGEGALQQKEREAKEKSERPVIEANKDVDMHTPADL